MSENERLPARMPGDVIPADLSAVEAKLMETVLRGVSGALVAGFAVARLVGLSKVVKNVAPIPVKGDQP